MAGDKDRGASGSAQAEIGKYLEILAKDPNSRVFAPLAEAYRKAGLLDDAVQTALEGLKVHPNYLGGRVALARAYFEKRMYADAGAEMQKVVRSAPDNLMAHKILGHVAREQGDLPAAEQAFRMVVMLDPRDAEAQQFLDTLAGGGRAAAPPPPPAPAPPAPPPAPEAPSSPPPLEGLELHNAGAAAAIEPPPIPELTGPRPTPPDFPAPEALDPPPLPAEPPHALPEELSLEEISIDAVAAPEVAAPPSPEAVAAAEEPEIEVFQRERWGEPPGEAPREEPAPAEPAAELPSPHGEDSPFEVFGRPMPGGPPDSAKGEVEAFREIELEPTAHEPAGEIELEEPEGVIEVFTREPRIPEAEARRIRESRRSRSEGGAFREIELETTAYQVPEPGVGEPPEIPLEEEIPRIDLAAAMEPARAEEPRPVDRFAFPDEGPQDWAGPAPAPVAEPPAREGADAYALEEEIPGIDLAAALGAEPEPAEMEEESGEEEEPDETPSAGPDAGRGLFSTETLAALYTSQGFHDRAAEIYRKLLAERPGDAELTRKLEAAVAQGGGPPPEAQDPGEAGPSAAGGTIRRLEALMNAFRTGKGRS